MRQADKREQPHRCGWWVKAALAVVGGALALNALSGCGKEAGFMAPPPPTVTAAKPLHQDVTVFETFTGKTVAIDIVDIRARVAGFLEQMKFEEGSIVKKGDLLYVIEQDQYKAELEQAQANVAVAKANFEAADTKYNLLKEAFEQNAASKKELVEAQAARDQAQAQISVAEASVTQARINLGYTEIRSPSTGRIAKTQVDVGNLVGHGQATLLTTVVTFDPMYVYFTINERDLLRWLEKHGKQLKDPSEKQKTLKVWLDTANNTTYPQPAVIDYLSPQVDPATGTTTVRAVVPNPDYLLYPGIFLKVKAPDKATNALLVPKVALQRDMQGSYLMKVVPLSEQAKQEAAAQLEELKESAKGTPREKALAKYQTPTQTVERINVELGAEIGEYQVIASGLTADDEIIIDGLQRSQPGHPIYVEPKQLTPPRQVNDTPAADGAKQPPSSAPSASDAPAAKPASDTKPTNAAE